MERGLLWLPLLAIFLWLAWAGWNEYQKVEAYRVWAAHFDRAKYDIYSVLGQRGDQVTWGIPTRRGPTQLETFSLKQVQDLQLQVDRQRFNLDNIPQQGRQIALLIRLIGDRIVTIPFTDLALATEWANYLQQARQIGWISQPDLSQSSDPSEAA